MYGENSVWFVGTSKKKKNILVHYLGIPAAECWKITTIW